MLLKIVNHYHKEAQPTAITFGDNNNTYLLGSY